MYFIAGALALLLLGSLWLRQTPLGWFILACGVVSLAALVTGGRDRAWTFPSPAPWSG